MKVSLDILLITVMFIHLSIFCNAFRPTGILSQRFSVPFHPKYENMEMKAAIPMPMQATNFRKLFDTAFSFKQLTRFGIAWRAIIVLITAYITKAKRKVTEKIRMTSNQMEMGWSKRSTGGSFARTIEVWIFAIAFFIKYVSQFSQFFSYFIINFFVTFSYFF
jgi:hypothetical protein